MSEQENEIVGYYQTDDCDLGEFQSLISSSADPGSVPHSSEIVDKVPVYHVEKIRSLLETPHQRRVLMAEWAAILQSGAGVFVIKNAQPDHSAIDAATEIFNQIIAQEKEAGSGADHFAAAGSNDRIWNSLQKLCYAAPETYLRYFASPALDAACEAWLGPNYQMTAQVNLVHPGGKAQQAHRDYHLGFQTAEISATYPVHVHDLSPLMTLQAGIAHCEIEVDAGPTKLLPYSQKYRPGYAAWRRPDFRECFEENFVQLPLQKGDGLFFNPALFHAAGENRTSDIERMVNLFQISSAFGRAMESIDRTGMSKCLFNPLKKAWSEKRLDLLELDAVVAMTAEGYSFPTNLDKDPPVGGLAPKSQQELLKEAVFAGSSQEAFDALLEDLKDRQRA